MFLKDEATIRVMAKEKPVSVAVAAKALRWSVETIRRRIRLGELPLIAAKNARGGIGYGVMLSKLREIGIQDRGRRMSK